MKCFAAFAKDTDIRMKGSSGGIFPLLSRYQINNKGIVYASVYDSLLNVKFERVETLEELERTFTSKYVQSRPGEVYKNIRCDLNSGRKVLFCGTPCQALGLKKYLKATNCDTDNIIILDFICHGVPGEEVFQKCMNEDEGPKCVNLNMRNKEKGWEDGGFSWKLCFEDGTEKITKQHSVPYMKGFLANLYLRPSCYDCKAKGSHAADITLGDFWGISKVVKNISADKGVSCVILRSKKGENFFSEITRELELYDVNYKDILAGNICLEQSVNKPFYRKVFLKKLKFSKSLNKDILNILKPSFLKRAINKLYSKIPHKKTGVADIQSKGTKLIYKNKELCCGCMACNNICPVSAIEIKKDKEGFFYPGIDLEKCVNCMLCKRVCPFIEN